MGESSTSEPVKQWLDVGIIAVLTVAANHLLPDNQHTEATTVIPFVGGGIAWGFRRLRKHLAYRQLVGLETKWLNEAVTERNKPGLSRKRIEELDADIATRRQALQELQRENTKVQ
ncbi:MAG: hypothetical protein M3Y54_07105 [Bacteroidota bacterium]|nr:hypothetical protein [Bacteroidota bacterium]